MNSRIAFIQPDTQRRAEQSRYRYRPANQPHHAKPQPHGLHGLALRAQLARFLSADLPDEGPRESTTMKLREAAHESALQLRQHRTNLLFALIEVHKFLLHRLTQLTEAHSANRVAHRDKHVRAG